MVSPVPPDPFIYPSVEVIDMKKIAVIGVGAIGGLLGAYLTREVTM